MMIHISYLHADRVYGTRWWTYCESCYNSSNEKHIGDGSRAFVQFLRSPGEARIFRTAAERSCLRSVLQFVIFHLL